jgi:hypothetical protein
MRKTLVFGMLSVLLLLVGGPPSALAETLSFPDGTTALGPMDIHRVKVVNEERLTIQITVDDLQRRHNRSASAWIDTDSDRRGPEYFIGSGLYDSDYQIARARDWQVVGSGPLACPIAQTLAFDRDVIRWTTGRACLSGVILGDQGVGRDLLAGHEGLQPCPTEISPVGAPVLRRAERKGHRLTGNAR